MTANFEVIAEARADQGKGASRRLRRDGKVPAVIYGAGKEPAAITVMHKDLVKDLENEAFYTAVINVNVDGNVEKAVLRDIQRHPAKPFILHADFLRINENEKLRVHVPLHFTNEETCEALKLGGQISHLMVEVEVLTLPANIPEYLEVDVQELGVGESLHLTDIKMPEGVEIFALLQGDDHDHAIVSIQKGRGAKADDDSAAEESESAE